MSSNFGRNPEKTSKPSDYTSAYPQALNPAWYRTGRPKTGFTDAFFINLFRIFGEVGFNKDIHDCFYTLFELAEYSNRGSVGLHFSGGV